ncbi:hypothetical protein Cycma_3621 [Cyclobacterium marinum DSM 745]|uniref:Uncharacterized protein n=2 Tax=Cyclobacterium marinum TaxID=104 RepID=G0J077_CYCMS|nr:hypothetical protein Cycma_3621 [Cyclobacterium marinum DSM 745]
MLFVLISLVFSCSIPTNKEHLALDIEKIQIPIDENFLNTYQVWDSYYENKESKLLAYNATRHSFDLFSLDKQSTLNQIPLEREGPDGIDKVDGLDFHNEDSVFLYSRGKLYISSLNGKISKVHSLYELFNFDGGGEPSINFYFKLRYNPVSKSVAFFIVYHNTDQKSKGNLPLIGLLNLETLETNYLPIYHTDFFKENYGNVGFVTYLGFNNFFEGNMIFNYQYQSNIYSLNTKGKLKEGKEVKHILPLINLDNIDSHAINNTHYLSPIPDPWRKLIYRFNWEAPIKGKEILFLKKKTSLTVFDSKLKKLQHYSLPDYTYQINNWFATKKGLFLNLAHPANPALKENTLEFHVVKLRNDKF